MKKIKRKPRVPFGSTMRKDLYEQLQLLSLETDKPITRLLDQAVELLLKESNIDLNNNEENDK